MTGSKKDFSAADITKPSRIKLGDRWRTSKGSDLPGLTSLFNTTVLEWVLQPALSYPWKCIFLVEISLFASEAISSVISILHDFPAWPAAVSICLCLWDGTSLHLCTLGRGETPGLCGPYFKCVKLCFQTNIGSCLFGAARWGCLESGKRMKECTSTCTTSSISSFSSLSAEFCQIASGLHGGSVWPCNVGEV